MIVLVDNYDSFTYNLAQYLAELGQDVWVVRNDKATAEQVMGRSPDAVVISPGPCTPNEAGISMQVIEACREQVPLLGVCLGHQCIGQVFGARIVCAEAPMHGKVSKVFHDEAGLFKALDNPCLATRYHSLVIDPPSLPEALAVTAKTWDDIIMGVRLKAEHNGGVPLEGVQFHPESILTDTGKRMLENFLTLAGLPVGDATGGAIHEW